MDHMKFETPDLTAQNIEKIAALFPGCVTEGPDGKGGLKKAINFELLRQMLSDDVLEGDEAYEFTWVGKKASIVEANKPIRKTLRPCPEESKNWDTTENLYIEGDNLEVLKLLQESYLGKVKMSTSTRPTTPATTSSTTTALRWTSRSTTSRSACLTRRATSSSWRTPRATPGSTPTGAA